VGFEALAKLPKLQELVFRQKMPMHQERVLQLWVQWLPHLRRFMHTLCQNDEWDIVVKGHHNNVVDLQRPLKLMLHEVALSGNVQTATSCELPQVKTLYLFNPLGDVVGMCDRFTTLSTLILSHAQMDVVESVLERVGQRLSNLQLKNPQPELLLKNILPFCPNLRKLKILLGQAGDDWSVPAGCCSFLEQVCFNMNNQLFPPGFILQVTA